MTVGADAGVFGDPVRFPPMTKYRDPINGVSWSAYQSGTAPPPPPPLDLT
jgi:hypothetical protein